MRRCLLIILFVLDASSAFPCTYRGVKIWPPTLTTLPTNPVFVITMGGWHYFNEMREGKFMRLYSGDDTVALVLTDTIVGPYAHFQAVLKTERKLKSNSKYFMIFDSSLTEYTIDDIYRKLPIIQMPHIGGVIGDFWSVKDNDEADTILTPLVRFKKSYFNAVFTSCQTVAADFRIKNSQPAPVIYKFTLKSKKSSSQYYVLPDPEDSLLYIDYDMIGLEAFRRYKLTVEAMGANGTFKSAKVIRFHTPYLKSVGLVFRFIGWGISNKIKEISYTRARRRQKE